MNNYPSKPRGFILLTTLMLISIMALLTLAEMQLLFIDYKAINALKEKHHAFSALEAAAKRLITTKLTQQDCLISEQDLNSVIDGLNHKKACILVHENQHYPYLIEELGFHPVWCAYHWRITIQSTEKHRALLQIHFAKPAKSMPCNEKAPIEASRGVLSWRYSPGPRECSENSPCRAT